MARRVCEGCGSTFQDYGAGMSLCGSCLTKEQEGTRWLNTAEEAQQIRENFRRNPPSTIRQQIEGKIGASLDTKEGRMRYAEFWDKAEKQQRRER